jgi:hypothetical protein
MKNVAVANSLFPIPTAYFTVNIRRYQLSQYHVSMYDSHDCYKNTQVMWQVFGSDSNSESPCYFCRMNKIHFNNIISISSSFEIFYLPDYKISARID